MRLASRAIEFFSLGPLLFIFNMCVISSSKVVTARVVGEKVEMVRPGIGELARKRFPVVIRQKIADASAFNDGRVHTVGFALDRSFGLWYDERMHLVKGMATNIIYVKGLTVRRIMSKVRTMKYVLTFVHNTGAYRAHALGCSAAVSSKNKSLIEPEKFESVESARAWADEDESAKAGAPTRSNFKACACCK